MDTFRKYWPYALPIVFLAIIILLALQFPQQDNALKWITSAAAFLLGAYGLIISLAEHRRRLSADRPDLAGTVTKITFLPPETGAIVGPGFSGRPMPIGGIEFYLAVRNRGQVATTVVACWLLLEGEKRDKAKQLHPNPAKLQIVPRTEEGLRVVLHDTDIERYRNLNACIFLRDAADHEFPILVGRIAPGFRALSIASLPVKQH